MFLVGIHYSSTKEQDFIQGKSILLQNIFLFTKRLSQTVLKNMMSERHNLRHSLAIFVANTHIHTQRAREREGGGGE